MALAEVTPLRALQDRSRSAGTWGGPKHPLLELVPGNVLRKGSTVTVSGSTSLALAAMTSVGGPSAWCAAVNFGDLGLLAVAESGFDLERLALVPRAGDKWPSVTAALIDAFDVVMLRIKSDVVRFADARRITARARERKTSLVVAIDDHESWPGADVRLSCSAIAWSGVGDGFGHLASSHLDVSVGGRGAAAQVRRGQLAMAAS